MEGNVLTVGSAGIDVLCAGRGVGIGIRASLRGYGWEVRKGSRSGGVSAGGV